ncbi:MAG: MarR family winged helix-turn-helix transcriptional regulator [Rubrobacter sp.]
MEVRKEGRSSKGDSGMGPGETWELLFRLFGLMRVHFDDVCGEFGLSSAQGRALLELEPGCPRAMRRLAERLGNDASNVTGIADRLEDRGLVERRPSDDDRRVKALAVTEEGEALRERFIARLKEAPSPITGLASEDRRTLRDILRRVVGEG